MKHLLVKILCLALCALALVCTAALAEPEFTLNDAGYITAVEIESETQTLIIPAKVGGTDVKGIAADVFSSYPYLKCILVEIEQSKYRSLKDNSLNFTSAPNLECIYFIADVNYNFFRPKIMFNSGVEILQYIDFSTDKILVDSITYENGNVSLSFWNIIPTSNGMTNYHITRTEQGSGESVSFNSEADFIHFDISNGMVRFTDNTVQPGQEYHYRIEVKDPFGRTSIPCETSISIPAAKPVDPPPDPVDPPSDPDNPPPDPDNPPSDPVDPPSDPVDPPSDPVDPPSDPVDPSLPETGDGTSLTLWAALACISLMGMMLLRRRKEA